MAGECEAGHVMMRASMVMYGRVRVAGEGERINQTRPGDEVETKRCR